MICNYHTHTFRCLHASGTDEAYVQTAIDAGISVLGFTDHTPWPYEDGYVSRIRMPVQQLDDYVASIRRLQEKYRDQIQLLVGLECEAFPQYYPFLEEVREKFKLDYMILGHHMSEDHEQFFYLQSQTPAQLEHYTEQVIAGMESGLFLYLAHPEVAWSNYPVFDVNCEKMADQIIEAATRLHMPLEYNLQGNEYRAKGKYHGIGYPCQAFWEKAGQAGCTAVIGMDAHHPEMLTWTDRYQEARALLQSLGCNVPEVLF